MAAAVHAQHDPPVTRPRRAQPWPIRIAHWLNAWLLVVMAGSGLQILAAYPAMGPRGATYDWYLLEGWRPGPLLTVGEWLAGGRHWHFAFAWFFLGAGLLYVLYLALSGEWRRRLFLPRRDARNAIETAKYYLRLRSTPPRQGFYNGLQRLAYTSTLLLALVSAASGLAIYKPLQLRPLTQLLGGYDAARAIHFLALVAFVVFTVGHVILVLLHPRALASIFTGGRREDVHEEDRTDPPPERP